MPKRNYRYFVGDFETTVFSGQQFTEVWAAACVELHSDDVKIFHSIDEIFRYLQAMPEHIICYFHNLKFDGAFWMYYLINTLCYTQALDKDITDGLDGLHFLNPGKMNNNQFAYNISNMGQWYRIVIKTRGHIIELRDSLKLLPFSVAEIGRSFQTEHQKLTMEYKGKRYAGCVITEDEQRYIANDVLVVKEALEILFEEGYNRLTIGSCCMAEYKKTFGEYDFKENFPNLYEMKLDPDLFGAETAGDYIKRSYRGGWCYIVEGRENIVCSFGFTADVNSLYPSMMHSESGNRYPYREPTFWKGNYIPGEALLPDKYFFIRFRTRFRIKPGKLPFVQIKGNLLYRANKMLTTSDVYNSRTGKYYSKYVDLNGELREAYVTLTMTMTDYYLFRDHYDVHGFEILDGCWFETLTGLFDRYIDKYRKIKQTTKGARRQLAKLSLNSLYGKMAATTNSSFKVAHMRDDGAIGYYTVIQFEKPPGYIPIGSAITSYARNFTIKAAQANYHGPDKPGFVYADTDSIHCDIPLEDVKGITIHDKNFCCWKIEGEWDEGLFVRQKTYLEHVTKEDGEACDPHYIIKCAGMPKRSKALFLQSMGIDSDLGDLSDEEKKFLETRRTITDFRYGLVVPGKLVPKNIPGGVVLVDTTFEIR